MTKFTIETKSPDGSWRPLPEVFDTQAQAEQHIIDFVPDNVHARITPSNAYGDSIIRVDRTV